MSDLRNLDLTETDGGLKTHSLIRSCKSLSASTTYNEEFVGIWVETPSGLAWTFTGIDANETTSFVPSGATRYDLHLSAVTLPAGATGHGLKPGYKYELVDPISSMTFSGTSTTTNDILTVAVGDSATLTSASCVIPLVGQKYKYSFDITYSSATTATVSIGGTTLYDKEASGHYTGDFTASTVDPLEIIVATVATSDFTLSGLTIRRA